MNFETIKIPPFFLNSIPKSGTHLLKEAMKGLPNVHHHPSNELYEGYSYDLENHQCQLMKLTENEFAAGHIYYSLEWWNILGRLNMKQLLIIRDPRDIVISFVRFIMDKFPHHVLDEHLKITLKNDKDRYLALIHGVSSDHLNYPNLADWYNMFAGWFSTPNTLVIRYEEFVLSKTSRINAFGKIVDFLYSSVPLSTHERLSLISMLDKHANPENSLTFRSGKTDNWKIEFDDDVKSAAKSVAGQLLINLGYENDYNW